MADVRDGVGPFLSIYLKGALHWPAGQIGTAMAASSIAAALFRWFCCPGFWLSGWLPDAYCDRGGSSDVLCLVYARNAAGYGFD